jgi:hypothetical protein
MDFLYISPEFPQYCEKFIRRLSERGARIWAIGETEFYFMPETLRSALKWYVQTDLKDAERVRKAVETLLSTQVAMGFKQGIDWVESHNEQWLRVEAFIRETFDIPGYRPPDLDRFKLKSEMKRIFMGNAPGERIESLEHGLALADTMGFPLILKPDEGVGAAGIYKIFDKSALQEIVPTLKEPYLVESFIDASIVTYDGLAGPSGEILFESSLVYGNGVLENVMGRDVFFYVNRQIPENLSAAGKRLVSLFDVRGKFFHFEFFRTDKDYLPIEINCRPPGGVILDMMNYSADVDLYDAYALAVMGNSPALSGKKLYYCGYLGRRNREYSFSHEALLAALSSELVVFAENPLIFQGAMCRYYYLVRSPSENEMWRMAEMAHRCPSP